VTREEEVARERTERPMRPTILDSGPVLSAVVAVASNGVIGAAGGMPWHIPSDLARFRAITEGHAVIMGRRTFESIGRPLPRRHCIVVTRDPERLPEGVHGAGDPASALREAAGYARSRGRSECFVIGGAALYDALMPRVSRLYLTEVHGEPEGDTVFRFDEDEWTEVRCEDPAPRGPRDSHDTAFRIFERRLPAIC
jgi:dihydrofolate reductase